MKKSFLYGWFAFSLLLNAQILDAQILVDPNFVNSNSKQGFVRIFEDEFNENRLNLTKWDISTSKEGDDTPCFHYLYDFMLRQVSVSNGNCVLKTEKATEQNSNCVPFNQGCSRGERGISGEIKTMQWRDYSTTPPDFPGVFFQNYNFPVGSYVEIRAKTPNAACNAGGSFWLFGGDQEIDVFETSGDEDDFTSGYYSGRVIQGRYYGPYERYRTSWDKFWGLKGTFPKILSCGFSFKKKITIEVTELVWDDLLSIWTEQTTTVATAGEDINPSDCFITYGVQFSEDGIRFYINNQLFYGMVAFAPVGYQPPVGGSRLVEMRPKTIRLSSGQLTGGGNMDCTVRCPTQMEVDYVRVFLPEKEQAIHWYDNRSVICAGKEDIIKATYLPGINYSWNSTAFDIEAEWVGCPGSYVRIKSKPGTVAGQSYPITLTSTFPDGHTETLTRSFFVSAMGSVASPLSLKIVNERGFCHASIIEPPAGCDCVGGNLYEWSSNNGLTWNNYGTFFGFPSWNFSTLCVRTRNCNGISSAICKEVPPSIRVPSHSRMSILEPKSIVYPNPANDFLLLQNIEELDQMEETFVEVVIWDALGKIHFKNKVPKNEPIDISKLPNGIFVLDIKFGKNSRKLLKFTKIKS